jgi:hypothetical protein
MDAERRGGRPRLRQPAPHRMTAASRTSSLAASGKRGGAGVRARPPGRRRWMDMDCWATRRREGAHAINAHMNGSRACLAPITGVAGRGAGPLAAESERTVAGSGDLFLGALDAGDLTRRRRGPSVKPLARTAVADHNGSIHRELGYCSSCLPAGLRCPRDPQPPASHAPPLMRAHPSCAGRDANRRPPTYLAP